MVRRKWFILIFLVFSIGMIVGCKSGNENTKAVTQNVAPGLKQVAPPTGISIHEAALNGQITQVNSLLANGLDVNTLDEDGRTALMYASFNGVTEIVRKLIEKGAGINLADSSGRTALMMASSGPYPETVKLLLDHQADPNIVDKEEHFTALMYAAAEGQLQVVKILLAYKADPSLKDIDGDNAATFAANNGHIEVVALLKKLN